MAHYANDCWDVEIKTLSGYVEVAGIADRSNFDLKCHSKNMNSFVNKKILPKKVKYLNLEKKSVLEKLRQQKIKDLEGFYKDLEEYCDDFKLKEDFLEKSSFNLKFKDILLDLEIKEKTVELEKVIPNVIEPSFGISRVLYCLVEQAFSFENNRNILKLKPKMAYKHVFITALISNNKDFEPYIQKIKESLDKTEIRYEVVNRSCSIGKKYATADEIGIPFYITLDEKTLENEEVTIRERDSTLQNRVEIKNLIKELNKLIFN